MFVAWESNAPEMTAATIMGTTCWPFNFIHVRGDGGKVSFIRQSSPSDCCYSAGKKKQTQDHDFSNLTAEAAPFYPHTDDTNTEHMVPSAKHSTEDKVDERGVLLEKLAAGESTSACDVCRLPPPPLPPVVRPR